MPRAKPPSPGSRPSPPWHAGSAEIAEVVARTAPAVLGLLAGRHAKEDVVRTLMRLAVTGRVDEAGGRYAPAAAADPAPDAG
jgi:hypothetical protein